MKNNYKLHRHTFSDNGEQYRKRVPDKVSPFFYGNTLLDTGCADGVDAVLMSPMFDKINGIDIEENEKWKEFENEKISFKKGSAEKIEFPDNTFDTVIEKDMLHHAQNPEQAVKEMVRVSKKRIIIIEANRYNPLFYINLTLIGNHQHFSKKRFRQIVAMSGQAHEFRHFSARVCPVNNKTVIGIFDKIENFLEKFPPYYPIIEYNLGIINKS